jgi:hypothetical protein
MRSGTKEQELKKSRKRLCESRKRIRNDSSEKKRVVTFAPKAMANPDDAADAAIFGGTGQRQKLLRVAEAIRKEGLDEGTLARTYKGELRRLISSDAKAGDKLLVDLLKEIGRFLEPSGSISATGSIADPPVVVQLMHDIPRPSRTRPETESYIPGEREAI